MNPERMGNPRNVGDERTDIWLTPRFILDALGPFDLDPCAPQVQPWPTAARTYTEGDNGLLQEWDGRIWLNPPYSIRLMTAFMRKMAEHDHGTALVFAKTETRVFFETVWDRASALLFIRSRLHFYDPEGNVAPHNSGAPSVLIAYGSQDAEILAAEPIEGAFVPLRIPRGWLINMRYRSWREALHEFFEGASGPVPLSSLYDFFAHDPKAARNPNYRAKVRQTLKRGQFVNVGRGMWERAA